MGEFLALIAAGFFGLSGLLARMASDHLDRDVGFFLCQFANAVVLVTLSIGTLMTRGAVGSSGRAILFFVLGGATATLFGRWAGLQSLQRLGPSRAAMYKNSQPLMTTVIAVLVLGETLNWSSALGAALIMIGVWYLSAEPAQMQARGVWDTQPGARAAGILWGLIAAVAYATGSIFRKAGMNLWPQPVLGAGVSILSALAGSTLNPRVWSRIELLRPPWHRGHLLFVLYGLCTAAAQLAFFSALQFSPVWIVNVIMATEPIFTVLLSCFFFRGKERLGRWVLISAVLVMTGVVTLH